MVAILKFCCLTFLFSCFFPSDSSVRFDPESGKTDLQAISPLTQLIDTSGKTLATRLNPPAGFSRINFPNNAFANYLQNLPLKPHGAKVKYFNGQTKEDNRVYDAVVSLPIGKRDLHQCADAVIRLRAEWLFSNNQFEKICFNFTNGFKACYSEWMKGRRIAVSGNRVWWTDGGLPVNTHESFWKYLETVFAYAGTLSLSKEMVAIPLSELSVGDVFIQGGLPGHAVIIVDMAVNKNTGEKLFLLAQSYMPAQEIQILKNPNNSSISPWYTASFTTEIFTPEWTFRETDLKRFR
jgi:hypothetical protein